MPWLTPPPSCHDELLRRHGSDGPRRPSPLWQDGHGRQFVRVALLGVLVTTLAGFAACPEGTELVGAPPPAGTLQFCARRVDDFRRYVPHGPWQTWHPNGQVFESGTFVDGAREGAWDVHDAEGFPVERGRWRHGARAGAWIYWRRDDSEKPSVVELGSYDAGLRVGLWSTWAVAPSLRAGLTPTVPPGRELVAGYVCRLSEGRYAAGLLDGVWVQQSACKQQRTETTYANDLEQGEFRKFDAEGRRIEQSTYVDGVLEGIERVWHPNGQLARETPYHHGEREGLEREWHPNGQLVREAPYRGGDADGIVREWHPNGRPAREIHYRKDEPNGPFRMWHESGVKACEGSFRDNRQQGEWSFWNTAGRLQARGVRGPNGWGWSSAEAFDANGHALAPDAAVELLEERMRDRKVWGLVKLKFHFRRN